MEGDIQIQGFTFSKIESTKLAVTPIRFIIAEAIIKFLLVLFIYIKNSPYDSLWYVIINEKYCQIILKKTIFYDKIKFGK